MPSFGRIIIQTFPKIYQKLYVPGMTENNQYYSEAKLDCNT